MGVSLQFGGRVLVLLPAATADLSSPRPGCPHSEVPGR